MAKFLTSSLVVSVLSLTLTATALAKPNTKMSLPQLAAAQQKVIQQDQHTINWWLQHKHLWSLRQLASTRHEGVPYDLWWHRQQLRWVTRELAETRAKLVAKQAVPHLVGWTCIHEQEGAWDSQTGNGYYGGLQMTFGWADVVGNAALLSPAAQIEAADRVAAAHGFDPGWMRGQWPNTYPPCAGLFP